MAVMRPRGPGGVGPLSSDERSYALSFWQLLFPTPVASMVF
jgi:hypothetical protein